SAQEGRMGWPRGWAQVRRGPPPSIGAASAPAAASLAASAGAGPEQAVPRRRADRTANRGSQRQVRSQLFILRGPHLLPPSPPKRGRGEDCYLIAYSRFSVITYSTPLATTGVARTGSPMSTSATISFFFPCLKM